MVLAKGLTHLIASNSREEPRLPAKIENFESDLPIRDLASRVK
jgi:hypothetical protein